MRIVPVGPEVVAALWRQWWFTAEIVSAGRTHTPVTVEAWAVADAGGSWSGLASVRRGPAPDEWELVSLNGDPPGRGAGTALLDAVKRHVVAAGASRLWLTTTNDNVAALDWYQHRGLRLVGVHLDAVTSARRLKPEIPEHGAGGVPLRDAWELEWRPSGTLSD